MTRPRVVIVGAGFGGMWAARGLANRPVDVTLVDRNNYHTFFPLLYQVAAAELGPTDIAHPVRSIFRRAGNVTVRMAEVTGLDLDGRAVLTDRGRLSYDYLILALGSEPDFFGVPGAAEHSFPLRWMDDAVPLRHHVLTRFEAAAIADAGQRRRLLTFVVVGGGPTGVEYAGALSELVFGPLLEDFPSLAREEVRIEVLEAGDRLLRGMPSSLARYAQERLARRRVTVRLQSAVKALEEGRVQLGDGSWLETETVVWTAGVQGDPRVARWGLPRAGAGRVPVSAALTVEGRPEVYAIGDLAYREDADGQALPQVAQVAIQQGRRAASNILRATEGRPPEPFVYRDPGMLAVIGRNAAAAHVFGLAFTGWTAWLLWLGIHISWLVGFRNRALVLLNWAWNYAFYRRAVRLILPAARARRHESL
jgi:NADH dehydrogenase